MPRKNRAYKKGEPFRDSRLFVIACEGEKREKEYFLFLAKGNRRIKIKLLAPENEQKGKSAPKWVLDRAINFESEFGLNEYDQLWLVLDVDRWPLKHIRDIGKQCVEKDKWNIAISNPCFEVWLIMHIKSVSQKPQMNCSDLKTELHSLVDGGYRVENFVPLIERAIERAKDSESDSNYFFPGSMETKVHHLASEILTFKVQ